MYNLVKESVIASGPGSRWARSVQALSRSNDARRTICATTGHGSAVAPAASSNARLNDNADTVSNYVGLAKMRATSRFSRARVYLDINARTYVLQVYNQAAKAWANDTSVVSLPTGIDFSFGVLDAPPTNTQPAIAFAAKCTDNADPPADIDGTSCIMFNSRGIPIDKGGSPIGGNAFYLTDGTGVRAITVTATPLIRNWWSGAGHAGWVRQ